MKEVLKQALDALETEVSIDWTNNDEFNASAEKMHDAITSLRQAIAKLESQKHLCTAAMFDDWFLAKSGLDPNTPLYTYPPQRTWVGLTDMERQMIINKHEGVAWETSIAIEQQLKEKNV
jgi:hypothetical protein